MAIETQSSERQISKYIIRNTLGEGKFAKVKLGYDTETQKVVALKIFKCAATDLNSSNKECFDREVRAMQAIDHPNILKLLDFSPTETYPKRNGTLKHVALLVTEFAAGGELFNYLSDFGAFSEDEARTYFFQLLSALECCHSQGIYHRDLKPENLLLDQNNQLKVADFGLCYVTGAENDNSGLLLSVVGTNAYMAPEVYTGNRYFGSAADIWSATVVLFIMVVGHPPYAMMNDSFYHLLAAQRYASFWEKHLRETTNISECFQNFINDLFMIDPNRRPTLQQMKTHRWMEGQIIGAEQLSVQIEERKTKQIAEKVEARRKAEELQNAIFCSLSSHQINPFCSNDLSRSICSSAHGFNPPPLPADIAVKDLIFIPAPAKVRSEADFSEWLKEACNHYSAEFFGKISQGYKYKVLFPPSPERNVEPVTILFRVYTMSRSREFDETIVLHLQRRLGDIMSYHDIQKCFKATLESLLVPNKGAIVLEEQLYNVFDTL